MKRAILLTVLIPLHAIAQPLNCDVVKARMSVQYQLKTESGEVFPPADKRVAIAEMAASAVFHETPTKSARGRELRRWGTNVLTVAFERRLPVATMEAFVDEACQRSYGD